MNKKEVTIALKDEIEIAMKKWQLIAEENDLNLINTYYLENPDLDADKKGGHFQQCVYGKSKIIVANLLATLERVPIRFKKLYSIEILTELMSVDEETEATFDQTSFKK